MSSFWKRFGPRAAMMRAAALENPLLLRRLADAPDKTFHVYAIRLEAHLAAHPAAGPAEIGEVLGSAKLRALLEAAWGTCPDGALSLLDRAGPNVHEAGFYARLHALLSNPRAAALLRRMSGAVSYETIDRVELLLKLDPALDAVPGRIASRSLIALDWLLRRLEGSGVKLNRTALRRKFRTVRGKWDNAIRDMLLDHPRVPAPWPGTAMLVPIETPRALKKTGQELRMCLGEIRYLTALVRNRSAYYRWQGAETAVIELREIGHGEWEIYEMNGNANASLKGATVREIEAAFRVAGVHPEYCIDRLCYLEAAE